MTKKEKTIRIIVNSVLLAVIVALGVTVYQAGSAGKEKKDLAQQQEQAKLEDDTEQEEEPMVDAGTSQVEAQIDQEEETAQTEEDQMEEIAQAEDSLTEDTQTVDTQTVEAQAEDTQVVEMSEEPAAAGIPVVNFTEDTLMIWPLAGDILLDYSMDQTIYHPTLNVYKYNPGIVISSAVDAPVLAASNGTVASVAENAETGTTVTLDMGNGYQAIYGQLQNVQVQEGQTIGESTIIGYVAPPTKYYSVEGSNLYFAMTKDGEPLDPISYLP